MAAAANAMGRPVLAKLKYFNGAIDFLLQTGNSWSESGGRLHGDLVRSNTEKTCGVTRFLTAVRGLLFRVLVNTRRSGHVFISRVMPGWRGDTAAAPCRRICGKPG